MPRRRHNARVSPPWTIRAAVPEDAAAWVETHLTALAETYAQMPAEFVASRRRRVAELVAESRGEITGAGPDERFTVALDADGMMVGIGHVCRGAQPWERRLLADVPRGQGLHRGIDDPGLLQLTTLYTLARTHGSGLGRTLAGALIGDQPCYLWIMAGNTRAEAFYRRLGFVPGSATIPSGPTWHHHPMYQLVRPA